MSEEAKEEVSEEPRQVSDEELWDQVDREPEEEEQQEQEVIDVTDNEILFKKLKNKLKFLRLSIP